ncbi:queuosine precursor transporter [Thiotrichales bacterium 19X7-9]|nr:queuosine precursor transporter [Thiotrichales bacterium 19X7-9]
MQTVRYRYSYYLLAAYLLAILLTIATANRMIIIFDIVLPGGIFIFPLTFMINDVASEVYGYSYPRMFIWLGLLCELFFSLYGIGISHLPYPSFFLHNVAYEKVFDPTFRFFFASLIGVFVGEFLNIITMSLLRSKAKNRSFIFRSLLSTAIGQLFLSIIVDFIAFFGSTSNLLILIKLMLFGFAVKMVTAIIFVVPGWYITRHIKSVEKINTIDATKNYNPFSLALS